MVQKFERYLKPPSCATKGFIRAMCDDSLAQAYVLCCMVPVLRLGHGGRRRRARRLVERCYRNGYTIIDFRKRFPFVEDRDLFELTY